MQVVCKDLNDAERLMEELEMRDIAWSGVFTSSDWTFTIHEPTPEEQHRIWDVVERIAAKHRAS